MASNEGSNRRPSYSKSVSTPLAPSEASDAVSPSNMLVAYASLKPANAPYNSTEVSSPFCFLEFPVMLCWSGCLDLPAVIHAYRPSTTSTLSQSTYANIHFD